MNKRPLIVSLLLAALCLPALRASEPADPSAHYVGMNLWFLNDWDGSNAFANIMMHAREWRNAAWTATAATDPEGWPTQDASTVIFGKDNQLGTYKLVFEGQAESISFLFGVNISGSITNKVYNAASALNTGFRNLRLYRPGHAADGSDLLVYYVNTSALDWQFTPNVWNLDTPKLDAIDSILNERSRVPVTHGQEVPGTLVARTQFDAGTADRVGTFFTTTLSGLDVVGGIDPGESLGLATNTRSPGRYRVRLSAATSGTASVRLHVNGAAAGEVTLVGAGTLLDYALGGSSPLTATLVPGEFRLLYPRARADILYQVEAATQLDPADWSPLPVLQDSSPPVGGTATGRLLLDPGADLRFLRLRATLQENTP